MRCTAANKREFRSLLPRDNMIYIITFSDTNGHFNRSVSFLGTGFSAFEFHARSVLSVRHITNPLAGKLKLKGAVLRR